VNNKRFYLAERKHGVSGLRPGGAGPDLRRGCGTRGAATRHECAERAAV